MIIIRVYRSSVHVGSMPLVRALVVDSATYYRIFIHPFGLEIVANSSDVVGRPKFIVSNSPLLIGYSFIIR